MREMHSKFDFPSVQGRKEWNSENYTPSHTNWDLASTLLVTTENFREVFKLVNQTGGNDADDGRLLQHIYLYLSANTLESVYWLGKHHQYNAARGRCRVLYETYLVLRALNRDQEHAADIYDRIRSEAKESPLEHLQRPPEEQSDALHSLRKSERKRVEKSHRTDSYKQFWMQLSDRGSHPASLVGILTDGDFAPQIESSIFTIALLFAFGIASQYLRTFRGTETKRRIHGPIDQIIIEVRLAVRGYGVPTLFRDELFFWDPVSQDPHSLKMRD